MSDAQNIDERTLQQLRQRAQNQGISVNELLTNLLALDATTQQTPYTYLDAAPSAVTLVDVTKPHQPVTYVNHTFEKETGYLAAEIIGRNLNFLQNDDREQPGRTIMREAIQQGQSCTVILRNYRKDGTMFWNEIHLAPLPNEAGEITHFIGMQKDITERVQIEQVLRHKENTLVMALRAAQAGVWVWDVVSGRITWDAEMEAMHGLKPGTFGGDYQAWRAAVHPDDLSKAEAAVQAALAGEKPFNEQFRILLPDGTVRHILGQAVVVRDPITGKPLQMIGVNSDITERVQLAAELRDSSLRYQSLFEQSNDAIYLITLDGIYLDANQRALDMLGYTLDELKALRQPQVVVPDERADSANVLQRMLAGEKIPLYERTLLRKDGSTFVAEINVGLVYSGDGDVLIQSIVRDITERVQMQQSLRESEERYKLLSDLTFEGVALHHEGIIRDVNQAILKMFGYERDELVGQQVIDFLFTPESGTIIRENIRKQYAHPYEVTGVRKDGSHFPIELEARQINPELRVASVRDITRRKQAETALRASEEKYRLLVEHSHQGMVIAQVNPIRLRFVSQPMQAITGYTPDELTRFTPDQLVQLIHPEDQARFFNTFRARLAGEVVDASARYRLIHQNGDIRHVDLYSSRIDYEGEPATQTVFLDITEQVEAERLKTRFQKEQEQNALVQRVVSMLSHDLRTPLAIIASSRDILHRYAERLSDEIRQEKLDSIGRQVRFATELLEDAVNTVRGPINTREFTPQPVNLAMLCQISINEIQDTHGSDRDMRFINKGSVETVSIDEVLVSRILINLLSNAIKYSPAGSKIDLELDQKEGWVILRVSDQGTGITEDDLPHIFAPFYRADEVHAINGTGLGLSIVKDCVERHQGRIQVESKLGHGSTFTVELPVQ